GRGGAISELCAALAAWCETTDCDKHQRVYQHIDIACEPISPLWVLRRNRRSTNTGFRLIGTLVPRYHSTMKTITRTQTGVRLESRLLKVLKALATDLEMSLGDLLEGIVLHAFEGKAPFSAATLRKVKALKAVYGLDLSATDSHQLREDGDAG